MITDLGVRVIIFPKKLSKIQSRKICHKTFPSNYIIDQSYFQSNIPSGTGGNTWKKSESSRLSFFVFIALLGFSSYFRFFFWKSTNLGGFFIPKGTMIVPLQWAVHMDSSVYQNPDTFDPNRFLDSTGKYVKLESFIPFQTGNSTFYCPNIHCQTPVQKLLPSILLFAGKRMCLGEEYARMLLFLFGGSVLQHFHISLENPPDFEGEVGITLTPKPHLIKFSLREPKF